MNRKPILIACGLAMLVAVIVFLAFGMQISVEVQLPDAVRHDEPTRRSAEMIETVSLWLVRAVLVIIPLVAGFFYFRERLRQRAHDRRKPPN